MTKTKKKKKLPTHKKTHCFNPDTKTRPFEEASSNRSGGRCSIQQHFSFFLFLLIFLQTSSFLPLPFVFSSSSSSVLGSRCRTTRHDAAATGVPVNNNRCQRQQTTTTSTVFSKQNRLMTTAIIIIISTSTRALPTCLRTTHHSRCHDDDTSLSMHKIRAQQQLLPPLGGGQRKTY